MGKLTALGILMRDLDSARDRLKKVQKTIEDKDAVIKAKEMAVKELKAMVRERDQTIRELKEENESLYERRY
jgi:hypothetical protein